MLAATFSFSQARSLQVVQGELKSLKPGREVYQKQGGVFFFRSREEVQAGVLGKHDPSIQVRRCVYFQLLFIDDLISDAHPPLLADRIADAERERQQLAKAVLDANKKIASGDDTPA